MKKSFLLSTILLTVSIVEHDCGKERDFIGHVYSYEASPEKAEYGLFLGRVVGVSVEYPAIVVSGVAVAAPGILVNNWEFASFCTHHNRTEENKCMAFNQAFESGGVGYFMTPVGPNFTQEVNSMISKGPVYDTKCIAVSEKHDALAVLYRDSWEVDCSGCDFLDAVFCNDKIVGVLLQGTAGSYPLLLYSEMQQFALKMIGSDASVEIWESFPLIGQARKSHANQIDICCYIINMSLIVTLLMKYISTSLI